MTSDTPRLPSATAQAKQVLCIKWGDRYGPECVNCLYGMVSRNITPPFRLICFTDNRGGIRPEVECYDLPDLGCPVPVDTPGKFRKVALWGHELFDLTGVALFVDLDIVVTGSLDPLFEFGDPDDVVLARNWVRPLEKLGQTSVFRYPIGKHGYILDEFQKDSQGYAKKYRFEQRYVTENIRGGVKFFPSEWIRHFRLDCLGPFPIRFFRTAVLPAGARIVIFPGTPDPRDAAAGRWYPDSEHLTPLAHLAWVFSSKGRRPFLRHLKRYLKPVPWVAEHWRE